MRYSRSSLNSKIRILFLNPPHPLKDALVSQRQIPISLLSAIKGVAKLSKVEIMILDLTCKNDMKKIDSVLSNFSPILCGITTMTYNYISTVKLINYLKSKHPRLKIIVGGIHANIAKEEIFDTSLADYICIGEGEDVLKEFVLNDLQADGLDGIMSRDEKGNVNFRRTENIDDIPPYELIDINNYRDTFFPLLTQRGCVFKCAFCSMGRNLVRFRTEKSVLEELNYLYRNGIRNIFISDDTFNLNLRRAKSLLEKIIKEYGNYFNLMVNLRGNSIDSELAKLLKSAGCKRAFIGVESGSNKILEIIEKGEKTEEMAAGIKELIKRGIETSCSFIIGLPGETSKTVLETIKYAIKLNPDIAVFNVFIPFPGTPIYEDEKKYGIRIHDKKWYLKGVPEKPIVSTADLNPKEIQHHVAMCYKKFYNRQK